MIQFAAAQIAVLTVMLNTVISTRWLRDKFMQNAQNQIQQDVILK
jgi:hypothetical protein